MFTIINNRTGEEFEQKDSQFLPAVGEYVTVYDDNATNLLYGMVVKVSHHFMASGNDAGNPDVYVEPIDWREKEL